MSASARKNKRKKINFLQFFFVISIKAHKNGQPRSPASFLILSYKDTTFADIVPCT